MKTQDILGDRVEVHFENKWVVLFWNEEERWVGTWWKKATLGSSWAASETVPESLEKGLELIVAKKATCWLADCRDMAVMPPGVQQWTAENWWPRALEAGFRWLAILLPKSVITKMAIDASIQPSNESQVSETRYFGEVDEAKAWLRSKR